MKYALHLLCWVLGCATAWAQDAQSDYVQAQTSLQQYKLDSSLYFISRAKTHYTTKQKTDSLALTLALEIQVVWEKGTFADAKAKADSGIQVVMNKLPAKSAGRVALNSIQGSLYAGKFHFDSATIFYNRALQAADREHPQHPLVVLYMNLSRMEMLKERMEIADHYYQKAYNTLQIVDPADEITLIDLLLSKAQLLIVSGKYNEALETAFKADVLIKKHYQPNNPKVAKNYANMSSSCYYLSRYEEALTYRQKALNVYLQNNIKDISNSSPFYITYYNMGQLYYYLNEHSLAANYLQKALSIGTNIYGRQNLGMVNILIQFGSVQQKLKNNKQAIHYFEEAYYIQKALNPTDYWTLAYIESFYGDVFADEGRYDSAVHYYNTSITNYFKADEAISYYALYTRAGLANAYAETGNTSAALRIQKDVLEKFRKNFHLLKQPIIEILNDIAATYNKANKPDSAQLYSDSCFLLQTNLKRLPAQSAEWLLKLPFSFKVSDQVYTRIQVLYAAFKQSKDLRQLLELLGLTDAYAVYISENIYKLRTQGALTEQSAINKRIFSAAIDACWTLSNIQKKQYYIEKAFILAEQGKALLLKLASNSFMVDDAMETGDPVAARDIDLRKKISGLNEQYLNAENGSDSLLRLMTTTIETYRSFHDSLKKSGNQYFQKRYAVANYLLHDIREALLIDGSTIIEYAFTGDYLYTFVVTKDSIYATRSNKDFVKSINAVQSPQLISAAAYRDSAYNLYRHLVHPIKKWFTGKKLIIVPDADLYYLNFETLVADSTGNDFASLRYLIRDYNISYLLSVNIAVQLKQYNRELKRKEKALLFAPVFTDSMKLTYKNQHYAAQEDSSYLGLFRQPFALQTVRNIYQFMAADMFLEKNALESSFKRIASQYNILHLGTHAQVNDNDPLQSRLFFAKQSDTASPNDDGILYAYEIYSMQLRAELAVLTACETGKGPVHSGEGVMSLAHSFMFAGCPSIVMSLWKIDEKTNAQIITDFYRHLKNGDSKSEALRKAKLGFLKKNQGELSNPFYWGGLCVIGDNTSLYTSNTWLYWMIGTGLATLALFYVVKFKRLPKQSK